MAARKTPTPRKAPARKAPAKRTRKPKPPAVDLGALGARVVSVFGPFASRVLIELPVDAAARLFADPLPAARRTSLVEAVERDLKALAKRDAALARSALAMSALALAYEIEHPYNSATSKASCAGELRDALNRLRELAPEDEEKDGIDDLTARRTARLAQAKAK